MIKKKSLIHLNAQGYHNDVTIIIIMNLINFYPYNLLDL